MVGKDDVIKARAFGRDGKPLGNMLTDEWADIWNGEACAARREFSAAMTGECPLRIHRQNGKEDA